MSCLECQECFAGNVVNSSGILFASNEEGVASVRSLVAVANKDVGFLHGIQIRRHIRCQGREPSCTPLSRQYWPTTQVPYRLKPRKLLVSLVGSLVEVDPLHKIAGDITQSEHKMHPVKANFRLET
jgi:hypothetical protein